MTGIIVGIDPVYSGVVFLVIFKGVSTLDSMVGYKTEELREIGWAVAKLDDVMNFIPARLSFFEKYWPGNKTCLYFCLYDCINLFFNFDFLTD